MKNKRIKVILLNAVAAGAAYAATSSIWAIIALLTIEVAAVLIAADLIDEHNAERYSHDK